MPDLRRRIQAEHLADSTGHCRDCPGTQWPCELYRLATEVDRRYGPCHSTAPWPGPAPAGTGPARRPTPPPARYSAPPAAAPPLAGPPVARAWAGRPSAGPGPVPTALPGPVPAPLPGGLPASLPGGLTPLPLPSHTPSPPHRPLSALPADAGHPSEDAVVLPIPRRTGGGPPAAPARPSVPGGLAALHDELRARREAHRARREELRARRGRIDPSRGRHDLRPYGNHPAGSKLPTVPQPKSELIDVLEDVLRWSH